LLGDRLTAQLDLETVTGARARGVDDTVDRIDRDVLGQVVELDGGIGDAAVGTDLAVSLWRQR
jgi:hypothetical protein